MTLDDLLRVAELLPPGASVTLPRDALLAAFADHAPTRAPAQAVESERWLTATECAQLLNVSTRWCYDHAEKLGAKRLSRRCVRFSSRAVARYMGRK